MNWNKLFVLLVFIFVSLIVGSIMFGISYLFLSLVHVISMTKGEVCLFLSSYVFIQTLLRLREYL